MQHLLSSLSPEVKAALISSAIATAIAVLSGITTYKSIVRTINRDRKINSILKTLLKRFDERYVPYYIIRHFSGGISDKELKTKLLDIITLLRS